MKYFIKIRNIIKIIMETNNIFFLQTYMQVECKFAERFL